MPTVRVKENEPFEVALRRFKRTVEKTGLLTELRAREYYEKPTAERKRKLAAAVKRNHKRFPPDFMFQLSGEELKNWRSHIVMSNPKARMGLRRRPYAFTEQGVAMLASILNSERAVLVSIEIVRTFVRLRQLLASPQQVRLDLLLHHL